jgi:hypothetical protein
MPTYTGTSANDSWTVKNPGTFTLDGLGGTDTLYLGTAQRSSYTITTTADGAVHVDSISGASSALHATLKNMEVLVFNSGKDKLDLTTYFGNSGPTAVTGTAGNDTLVASSSTSIAFDGLAGIDTVAFAKARTAYAVTQTSTGFTVTDGTVTDTVTHIERLQFADNKLALDLDGHAGQTAKILGAVFGASSVANASYVGIGLQQLDNGLSYEGLMQLAIDARLGAGASHGAVVDLLYTNVAGSAPNASDKAYYVGLLDSGAYTPASLGVLAAETGLNQTHIDLVGLAHTGLSYTG